MPGYFSSLLVQRVLVIEIETRNALLDHSTFLLRQHTRFARSGIPMLPIKLTLIPVCSNFLPSFGRTMTDPFTDSPSLYSGAFSLRSFPPVLNSTMSRASSPSSRISMSHTGLKKLAIAGQQRPQRLCRQGQP